MNLREVITQPQTNLALRSACAGAFVWFALLFVSISDVTGVYYIERLFLLAPLVIVPLGLSLIESHKLHGLHTWPYRIALLIQPVGALFCVCSFFFNQGFVAAMLACVWLFVTSVIALFGAWRFVLRGAMRVEEICLSFGLMAIAIGGAWFVMSRFGAMRAQFGDTIVLLTAVHFHYTGFAASLLMSFTGRVLRAKYKGRVSLLYYIAVCCHITGVPIVAAGITFSLSSIGLIGAVVISLGLWLFAIIVMVKIIDSVKSWPARVLLFVSSFSSATSMILACLYAYSLVSKKLIINIPQMAKFHGMANAIGFALCGMLAWLLIHKSERNG